MSHPSDPRFRSAAIRALLAAAILFAVSGAAATESVGLTGSAARTRSVESAHHFGLTTAEIEAFSKLGVDQAADFAGSFRGSNLSKCLDYYQAFFDRPLSRSEAQRFVEKIPPFTMAEDKTLENRIVNATDRADSNDRLCDLGHQLCVFGDGTATYVKAVFLTDRERRILRNAMAMSRRLGRAPAEFFSTTLESKLCSIDVDDTDSIFIYPRPLDPKTVERLRADDHTKLKPEAVALFDLERFAASIRLYNTIEGKRLKSLDELAGRYIPDILEFPDPWNRPYRFDAEKGIVYSTGPDGKATSDKNTFSVPLKPPAGAAAKSLKPEAAARRDLARLAAKIRIFMAAKNRLPRSLTAYEEQYRIGEADRVDPWGAYYLMDSDEAVLYSLGPDGLSPRSDKAKPPATAKDDIVVPLKLKK